MKRFMKRFAFALAVPVTLFAATQLVNAKTVKAQTQVSVLQGSDLAARVDAVEKRIVALKTAVKNNAQNKQHQGAVATLENRKNTIKFKMKGTDAASKAQLEQDLKQLEDKVTELEKSVK